MAQSHKITQLFIPVGSMFQRKTALNNPCSIIFEGTELVAQIGEPIACALLAAGIVTTRKAPENNTLRGPYCLIGNCFECLVYIEGLGVKQACRTSVAPNMVVSSYDPQEVRR